jgi:hypothetical protein
MRLAGLSLTQVSEELGMSISGTHELLAGYMARVPPGAVEDYRLVILGRLDEAHAAAHKLVMAPRTTPKVRLDALRVINQLARTFAVVANVVKQAPPVVLVNQFESGPDLSRLPIEDIEMLQRVQMKLLEAPVETTGEVVEDGGD